MEYNVSMKIKLFVTTCSDCSVFLNFKIVDKFLMKPFSQQRTLLFLSIL